MKRKNMTDNKYNLYQIYEFKIIVYDMKLKWNNWHHAYDHVCDDKKNLHMINWKDGQVKIKRVF